jgi:hypothetical protein
MDVFQCPVPETVANSPCMAMTKDGCARTPVLYQRDKEICAKTATTASRPMDGAHEDIGKPDPGRIPRLSKSGLHRPPIAGIMMFTSLMTGTGDHLKWQMETMPTPAL